MVVGIPLAILVVGALALCIRPGDQVGSIIGREVADAVLYVLGIIMSGVCITSVWVVYRWASRFDPDDFSNPEDFPVKAARRWLVIILVNALLCWTVALSAHKGILAVIMLLFSVALVIFVITALHPNRMRTLMVPEGKNLRATPFQQRGNRKFSRPSVRWSRNRKHSRIRTLPFRM